VNTGLTNYIVHAFAVSGTNLFAATWFGGGVFLSTNNGTSWTAVNAGLTDTNVAAFAVSGTNLFAGTYLGGVFLSTNNGTSWTAVNTGLTNYNVYALAVSGTNLFGGTDGGVWRRPLSEMITSVDPAATEMPREFSLDQNYPNPFNPSTTIRYEVPRSLRVSLKVYNTLGQDVATLVNEEKPAGVYRVQFNGSALASGVYFYCFQAGDHIASRRMLVLK
jgi:hypothetical protein